MELAALPVLAVDCQTTGSSPERGRLLEIAWCGFSALGVEDGLEQDVTSQLVAQPRGERLPRRIEALTGIRHADLARARPPSDAWRRFCDAAASLGVDAQGVRGPVVAHFARFERAFLEALHRDHGIGGRFPLDLLCTHEIVCRLLPGLPRRGLRAVAGRFGHVIEEKKRAAGHVRATVAVWAALVRRLRAGPGLHTLEDLRRWMREVAPVQATGRDFAVARADRLKLPEAPGTYRMLARGGRVLYLGKATNLRRRVNSYFQKKRHPAERTLEMLTQVREVAVDVAGSALEAALVESDEIKRLAPPYNVALRVRSPSLEATRTDRCALAALRALLDAPSTPTRDARWLLALGLPTHQRLTAHALGNGLATFARRYDLASGAALGRRTVVGLGARLWRLRRALRAAQPPARDRHGRGERRELDAGHVVSLLEGTVTESAHRHRRRRWFRRLGNGVLRWTPGPRLEDGLARQLVLSGGRVVTVEDVPWSAPFPPRSDSRGRAPDPARRDEATHDRLRVLTTEMRRLLGDGRRVELLPAWGSALDATALARRLFWL